MSITASHRSPGKVEHWPIERAGPGGSRHCADACADGGDDRQRILQSRLYSSPGYDEKEVAVCACNIEQARRLILKDCSVYS